MAGRRLDNRRDVLLLLLYSPGRKESINEPVTGRTRLTKMLFLFKMEALPHFRKGTDINEENFYEFFPWRFGPFSTQVYDDLTFFVLRGFIQPSESQESALPESAEEWERWLSSVVEEGADEPDEYLEEEFTLTDKGVQFTRVLYDQLSQSQKRLLREFKHRSSSVPLRTLLRYVYKQSPEMVESSEIRGRIVGNAGS